MKKSIFLVVVGLFVFAGCAKTPVSLAEPNQPEGTASTQTVQSISIEMLQNAEIFAPQLQQEVRLTDGKYESSGGTGSLLVEILPQSLSADINGDGQPDEVVLLAENGGSSGVFVSLICFLGTADGFKQTNAILVDDRPVINSLVVNNGKIALDAVIHADSDPMSSTSLQAIFTYQLINDQMTLTGLEEKYHASQRKITISQPTSGDEVNGKVSVAGSMPVAPFENMLRFRFYDEKGKILTEGAFPVQAKDVGQPATFDNLLDVPALQAGSRVRLELSELSANDGSPLCMTSIELVVK